MKKFIIAIAATVLTVSVYAMSKTPADASICGTDKACVVKEACPAGAEAMAACPMTEAKKAACTAEKTVKEAGCVGGTCPLKK